MARRNFYILEEEFDTFQLRLNRRKIDRQFIVKGCAGSGKSILALWNVKQIQQENRGSFYFIVYTKALKQFMKDAIKEIGLNPDRVLHLDEWKGKGSPRADYIVVDEAQDFTKEEIELFIFKSNKVLRMYGDTAQQLYAFKHDNPLTMEDIAYLTRYSLEQLVFNHRLPKKIARFAEYLENTDDDLAERCQREGQELPKVLKYDDLNKQLDAIIDIINTHGYDDVGILFTYNYQVKQAYEYFQSKNFQIEVKYDNSMNLDFSNNLPKLTTYHSSKGLQFEAVFIPHCENKHIIHSNPRPHTKQEEIDSKQSALYVALTRSYQDLFIMYSSRLTSFFDDIPEDLYETSLITEDIDW
jgi:superfamily I DNA/RNA helicase